MDGDVLLQTGRTIDHSARGHSSSHTENQLPFPSASLPRGAATEVQNVCGQRHGRVVLRLVRELALDSGSSRPRNPKERAFNFNYHDFLVVWNKMNEAMKLGELNERGSTNPSTV